MKKLVKVLFIPFLALLVSCGSAKNDKVLNIYTWESFIPEEVIENFEKETGIKVNLSYYDTNDVMITKLLTGTDDNYDIVSPSTDFVEILIEKKLAEKLNKEKLKEVFKNLDAKRLKLYEFSQKYDPNLMYSIPYGYFATGITVNKNIVKDAKDKDLDIFLDDNFKGRMTMLDDSRELLGLVLQNLGFDSDTEDDNELEIAKNKLLEMKKNIAKFDSMIYGKGLATGEFFVSHGYPDVFYEIEEDREDEFEYFLPKGAMMYIDSMVIVKNAKNKENAYKFLNYLYKPENFKYTFEKFRQIPVVKGIYELTDTKPILDLEQILENAKLPSKLSDSAKEKQDRIYNEIKLEK